jgi:hypothetical protein
MRKSINLIEKILVYAEQAPWYAIYRAIIGFVMIPLSFRLCGKDASNREQAVILAGSLLALRFVPAILRHVLPFSKEIRMLWSRQRLMAKRYDSYQWRKIFWIGLGLFGYRTYSSGLYSAQIILECFCLLTGALGLIIWRKTGSKNGF